MINIYYYIGLRLINKTYYHDKSGKKFENIWNGRCYT